MSTVSEIVANRNGINKLKMNFRFSTLTNLLRKEAIKVADWNREKVASRPGDSTSLMKSMANGWSISMFLGYWNGKGHNETTLPTPENPSLITEGGHRLRWIKEIIDGHAAIDGHTLDILSSVNPVVWNHIQNYIIPIEVTVHDSGIVPIEYMKGEYRAVNGNACVLTVGEILRASTDRNFNELLELLKKAFEKRKMTGKRDKPIEVCAGIIAGLVHGNSDKMTTKAGDVMDYDILDEQMPRVKALIEYITDLEANLHETYKSDKKKLALLKKRAPSLDFDGPMIHALIYATTEEEKTLVIQNILKFYELSLGDEASWSANKTRVCSAGDGNPARAYNKKRYAHGWGQLMDIITPEPSEESPIDLVASSAPL